MRDPRISSRFVDSQLSSMCASLHIGTADYSANTAMTTALDDLSGNYKASKAPIAPALRTRSIATDSTTERDTQMTNEALHTSATDSSPQPSRIVTWGKPERAPDALHFTFALDRKPEDPQKLMEVHFANLTMR
ncbi:hypothetical protein PYCC9005_001459 [Savitreella phatthalungensis]